MTCLKAFATKEKKQEPSSLLEYVTNSVRVPPPFHKKGRERGTTLTRLTRACAPNCCRRQGVGAPLFTSSSFFYFSPRVSRAVANQSGHGVGREAARISMALPARGKIWAPSGSCASEQQHSASGDVAERESIQDVAERPSPSRCSLRHRRDVGDMTRIANGTRE